MTRHEMLQASGGQGFEGGQAQVSVRLPVLIMLLGRGRTGKTAVATILVQVFESVGVFIEVWNADQQNASHNLSRFHRRAKEPPEGASFEDRKAWFESMIVEQSRRKYDALVDFPGGDSTLMKLAQEVRLIKTLEKRGIRPVAFHVVGAMAADLDYLRHMEETGLFMPEATVIVLNAGLVTGGRSVDRAFDEIRRDRVVENVLKRGGKVVKMPALPCMPAIMDLGLSFRDVSDGRFPGGEEPLSFFDQERTARWLEDEIPEMIGGIPSLWLPELPAGGSYE